LNCWIFLSSDACQWMNTPTEMNRSSASSIGIVPSLTQSATAFATPYCAGPNICTACLAPLMVTLLNITVTIKGAKQAVQMFGPAQYGVEHLHGLLGALD